MIRVFEMFSGYGGAAFALAKAGIPYECVGFSEIDKYAIQCFEQNHGGKNYGDCRSIKPEELPDFDLLTGGFPCTLAGTLITTQRGLIPIEEVLVGDIVLTHNNRWRKVLKTMNQPSNHYYNVKIQGSPLLQITENHPFYCKKMIRVWNNIERKGVRTFSDPDWIPTKEIRYDDFVGFGNYSDKHCFNEKNLTEQECWLIGRYVADGFISNGLRKGRKNSFNHKVVFCVGKAKQETFLGIAKESGYNIAISEERTAYKNIIIDERFMQLCLECGKGALNKKIPFWIMNLPKDKLEIFLEGYMAGDGGFTNDKYCATSISKILIYQLGQIVHRVYHTPYNINYCKRPSKTIIEGREVNQHDTWQIRFDIKKNKQDNFVYLENNIWGRFVSKERIEENVQVYNIEVEDDNSYVANNVIIHNCQSFSVAGKMNGETDARGTLFYEIIRIAEVKKPKWMLLENVKGLTCKKFKSTFDKILSELDRIGYAVTWKVLNSKDYGIPQSRARVWFVCIRKDIYEPFKFSFPAEEPLKIFIKDILEPNVADKYYLSDLLQERFATYLKNKTGTIYRHPMKDFNGYDDISVSVKSSEGSGNQVLVRDSQANGQAIVANRYRTLDGKGECFEQREDGCTNNITSVAKDNLLLENNKINVLGTLDSEGWEKRYDEIRRVYGSDGIAPTLPTGQGGGVIPKIQEPMVVGDNPIKNYKEGGDTAVTLSATSWKGYGNDGTNIYNSSGKLRRLTPKECFRLMGFLNDEIKLEGISDSQRYKLAGNGWEITVASKILKNMLSEATKEGDGK